MTRFIFAMLIACFTAVLTACGGVSGVVENTSTVPVASSGPGGVHLDPALTVAFVSVTPASPSASINPVVVGTFAGTPERVAIFADDQCAVAVGGGTAADFAAGGITARVYANQSTSLSARAYDSAGNFGPCAAMTAYVNDSEAPNVFSFQVSNPNPTNDRHFAFNLAGDLASATEYCILENDVDAANCVWASMPLPANYQVTAAQGDKTLTFYARDAVGNVSRRADANKVKLDTVAPSDAAGGASIPGTPSNIQTPLIKGTMPSDASTVRLYSDMACSIELAQGTRAQFTGSGLMIPASYNATTAVYAITSDDAGNSSSCAHLFDFTHQAGVSAPLTIGFLTLAPASPSSNASPVLTGYASSDIATVNVYSDSTCASQIGTGTKSDFEGAGLTLTMPANAFTAIYGKGIDGSANTTGCTLFATYRHDSAAPTPVTTITHAAVTNLTTTTPSITWSGGAVDAGSGLARLDYSIGVAAGDNSIVDWTAISGSSPQSFGGLSLSAGVYYFNLRAVDKAGNISSVTSSTGWTVDTTAPATPPVFTSFTPSSPSNTSVTPVVKGTTSADTATVTLYSEATCTVQLASGTKAAFAGAGLTIAASANSGTTVYAKAFDAAGNATACTLLSTYTHDSVSPTLSSITIGSGFYANSTSVSLALGGIGGAATEYCLLENSTTVGSCSWAALPVPGTFTLSAPNAPKQLSAWVRDAAGNVSTRADSNSLLLDTVNPVAVTTVTHAAVTNVTNSTPTVTWSGGGTDAGSGFQRLDYSIGTSAGDNSTVDWTAVTGPSPQSFGGLALAAGTYFFNIRVVDKAGNVSSVTSSTGWTVDTTGPATAPTYTSFTPSSPSSSSVTPAVKGGTTVDTATVTLYSDAACAAQIGTGTKAAFTGGGITITVASNATTSVYAKAFDAAGNGSPCGLLGTYTHDGIAPTLSSVSIGTGSYTNVTTVSLATGSIGGAATEYCLLQNNTNSAGCVWTALPFPTTFSLTATNETKQVSAWVRDAAGNVSTRADSNNLILDTVAPTWAAPALSYPTTHSNVSTSPIATYSQSATDATSVIYQYALGTGTAGGSINNLVDWTTILSASFQISGLSLADGSSYYLRVRAVDAAGNSTMSPAGSAFTVTVVVPSPILSSVVPGSPNNTSGTPSVRGSADASVETVSLYSDSSCSTLLVSGTRADFLSPGLTVTAPANQILNIYAKATDTDISKSSLCIFLSTYIYDTQAPLPVGTISDGDYFSSLTAGPTISWVGGGVDGGSGFNRFEYAIGTTSGGTNVRGWTSAGAVYSVSPTGLSLTNGTRYYASVRAVDNVGNTSTPLAADGWLVDTSAPTLAITDPTAGLLVKAESRAFTGTCEIGSSLSITYGSGTSGPATVPCTAGAYSVDVDFSGVDGDRTITVNQTDVAGNVAAPVSRTINWQPTFNLYSDGLDNTVNTMAYATDGSRDLFVGGTFTQYGDVASSKILRVQYDGDRVETFSTGSGFTGTVNVVLPANDGSGQVYVGGAITNYNGSGTGPLVRLNADGSLDTTFLPAFTGTSLNVYALEYGPSGKIYVGGHFTGSASAAGYANLMLLNTNGTADTSFDVKTTAAANGDVYALRKSADGNSLFVAGNFTTYRGSTVNRVMKLNATTGALAGGWATGATAGVGGVAYSLVLAPDNTNEIYVGGNFTAYGGVANSALRLVRLDANGAKTAAFNATAGTTQGFDGIVRAILPAQDGSGDIYVGGDFTKWRGVTYDSLVRLNADGTVDGSFTNKGFSASANIYALAALPAATNPYYDVMIGGSYTSYGSTGATRLSRLNSDGSLDIMFPTGLGATGVTAGTVAIRTLLQETDGSGKMYLGGAFTGWNGTAVNRIVRLNGNGTVDSGFVVGTGFNDTVYSIVRNADGKIYVGGDFTTYKGTTVNGIVRLNADGSIDSTFAMGTGFFVSSSDDGYGNISYVYGGIRGLALAPDGSGDLYVTGTFTSYKGVAATGLIRLNADGSKDTAFAIGSGLAGGTGTVVQPVNDGTNDVYVSGSFTSYNGTPRNRIVRLTPTGVVYGNFIPSSAINGTVQALQPVGDGTGDMYVGGLFTRGLIRMKNTGAAVSGFVFDLKNGSAGSVNALAIDPNGKLFATGAYTTYAGKIVAITSDAAVDLSFALGAGLAGSPIGWGVQYVNDGSGDIYIYGCFTSYNGLSRVNIVRVRGDGDVN